MNKCNVGSSVSVEQQFTHPTFKIMAGPLSNRYTVNWAKKL